MNGRVLLGVAVSSGLLAANPAMAQASHRPLQIANNQVQGKSALTRASDRLAHALFSGIARAQARAAAAHEDLAAARAEIRAEIERVIAASGVEPEMANAALVRVQQAYKGCAPAVMFYQQSNCSGDVLGAIRLVQQVVLAEINASYPQARSGQNGGGLITAPALPNPSASATASYVGHVPT